MPPTPQAVKYGIHILSGYPNADVVLQAIKDMTATGNLRGATVVNDYSMANLLVNSGVDYVVHRDVLSQGDAPPWCAGISSDIQIGIDHWNNNTYNQRSAKQLDPRVFIQPFGCNEQNFGGDGYFYLGLMQAADKQGRKLAIFGDGTGQPADMFLMPDGKTLNSATWSHRVASGCMRYGKANGHIACIHAYGKLVNDKETQDFGSEIWPDGHRDDLAWFWFGGRYEAVWKQLIPADSQMSILIGECGSSAADKHGPDAVDDIKGYQLRLQNNPFVKAFCYWTIGGQGAYTFERSSLDGTTYRPSDLPLILQLLKGG